jgi:hypothetical protein
MLSRGGGAARQQVRTLTSTKFHQCGRYTTAATLAAATATAGFVLYTSSSRADLVHCDSRRTAHVPVTGDIIQTGTPVAEPATGILFPQLCNSYVRLLLLAPVPVEINLFHSKP